MQKAYPPKSGVRPRPAGGAEREAIHRLRTEVHALREENARLVDARRYALVDSLTGMCGRRYFDRRLRQELSRCDRFSVPVSLVIAA